MTTSDWTRSLAHLDASLSAAETPTELARSLDWLLRPGGLEAIAAPMIGGPPVSPRNVADSYDHPNGFEKLVLHQAPLGHKVVLHAWWPSADRTRLAASNLHDHRWHFASAVLAGGYRFSEFRETPLSSANGRIVFKHSYESPAGGGHYRLHPRGRCRLIPIRQRRLREGSTYLLPCDVIHDIDADEREPTITLFVQGPPVQASTRVFSRTPLDQLGEVSVRPLEAEEYRCRLRRAMAQLAPRTAARPGAIGLMAADA